MSDNRRSCKPSIRRGPPRPMLTLRATVYQVRRSRRTLEGLAGDSRSWRVSVPHRLRATEVVTMGSGGDWPFDGCHSRRLTCQPRFTLGVDGRRAGKRDIPALDPGPEGSHRGCADQRAFAQHLPRQRRRCQGGWRRSVRDARAPRARLTSLLPARRRRRRRVVRRRQR